MDKQLQAILNEFIIMFIAHIRTKTTDRLFHKDSPEFYQFGFDMFHKIFERMVDIGAIEGMDCYEAKYNTMDSLLSLQGILNTMIDADNTKGMDNLLRGLYDELEDKIGNMKSFIVEEKEELVEEESSEKELSEEETPKKKTLFNIKK